MVVTAPAATPTPRATPSPRPSPAGGPSPSASRSGDPTSAPLLTIHAAVARIGEAVTVEGTVSAAQGFLDSSGERVSIEDDSGGLLLRLAPGAAAGVGDRLRATGVVGTYYGAPQLTASSMSSIGRGNLAPTIVHAGPLPEDLEWRLVTLSGVVETVTRDGDAWRAELIVGSSGVPIAGIDRSGIPSTALAEGRYATVTGIVKRAYPTAADQRFALLPRSTADIVLGGVADPGAAGESGVPGTQSPADDGSSPGSATATAVPDAGGVGSSAIVASTDLLAHVDELVTVGGYVSEVHAGTFTVEDATGIVSVRLVDGATTMVPMLAPGALVNVSGIVALDSAGHPELVVDDPASVLFISVTSTSPARTTATLSSAAPVASSIDVADAGDNRSVAGIAALLLACAAGAAACVTAIRVVQRHRLAPRLRAWFATARG